MAIIIETKRLILRAWKQEHAQVYYQINQDPKVIEFLRGSLPMEQVNDFILEANKRQDNYGYTLWAAELKETGELIGFLGLSPVDLQAHFTPAVEVGWRLGSQYWGKGYATEGANAALSYGFKNCGLKEIVSFTVPANFRSIHVMEKIGLKRDPQGDFAYPKLSLGHTLSWQILYRLTANDYFNFIEPKKPDEDLNS